MDEVFEKLQNAADVVMELRHYLLYRLAVYAGFGGIMIAYWAVVLTLHGLASELLGILAFTVILAGLAGHAMLFYIVRGLLHHMAQASFVAVLTQALAGGLPAGAQQKEIARRAVAERFPDVRSLSAADHLITGVVKSHGATSDDMASWVPIPGMHQVPVLARAFAGFAARSIEQAILSFVFAKKDQPVWPSVREGLVLYSAGYQPVLKLATSLVVVDWLCAGVLFVMLLMVLGLPTVVVFTRLPYVRGLAIVVPFVVTYLVRQVLYEPLAVTAVAIAFQRAIKGKVADSATEEKLAASVPAFAQVVARAEGNEPAPAAAAAPAAAGAAAKGAPAARPRQRPGGLKKP